MLKHTKKLIKLAFVALVAVLTINMLPIFPAAAAKNQTRTATPDNMWDVSGVATSNHTGTIQAIVFDLQEYNGKMYVGGKFLNVVEPNRSKRYDQPFLAAFDLHTGVWDQNFRPELNAPVYAIDLRPDGKLLIGGEFTGGMAAVDPVTGALDKSFKPDIKHTWGKPAVFDIEVEGSKIYAGGTFVTAQGLSADHLGRFDSMTGQLDTTWRPTTEADNGEVVYGLEVDAARERVYAVGKFGAINGNTDAAYFGIMDTNTGALKADVTQGIPAFALTHYAHFSMWQHDVQAQGDKVYIGGQAHQTLILNADDLKAENSYYTDQGVGDKWRGGDTQVMFLGKNTLWSGCHCWGSVGPYKLGDHIADPEGLQTTHEFYHFNSLFRTQDPYGHQTVKGLYGVDLQTREILPVTFDLSGAAGVWALYEDSRGQLWAGGHFTSGGGKTLSGLARFKGATEYSRDGSIANPEPLVPVAPVPVEPELVDPVPATPDPAVLVEVVPAQPVPTPAPLATPAPGKNCRQGPAPAEFDVASPANASIYRLYCAYFLRYPDTSGFNYWTDLHASGATLEEIAYYFQGGEEFSIRHASKSNTEFVSWVYRGVMEREPDAEGHAYWVDLLNRAEITRSDVIFFFSESQEFRESTKTI